MYRYIRLPYTATDIGNEKIGVAHVYHLPGNRVGIRGRRRRTSLLIRFRNSRSPCRGQPFRLQVAEVPRKHASINSRCTLIARRHRRTSLRRERYSYHSADAVVAIARRESRRRWCRLSQPARCTAFGSTVLYLHPKHSGTSRCRRRSGMVAIDDWGGN